MCVRRYFRTKRSMLKVSKHLKDLYYFENNFTRLIHKIYLIPFSICSTIIFIYIVHLSGIPVIIDNDLTNWVTLSIEVGLLLPIAYIVGRHFFKKEEDKDKQKELRIVKSIMRYLKNSENHLKSIKNSFTTTIRIRNPLFIKSGRLMSLGVSESNLKNALDIMKNERSFDDASIFLCADLVDIRFKTLRGYLENNEEYAKDLNEEHYKETPLFSLLEFMSEAMDAAITIYKNTINSLETNNTYFNK